jgi:hypothetical protein
VIKTSLHIFCLLVLFFVCLKLSFSYSLVLRIYNIVTIEIILKLFCIKMFELYIVFYFSEF